jgi:hypothetical protein
MLTLKIIGVIPPLPSVSSWSVAWLSTWILPLGSYTCRFWPAYFKYNHSTDYHFFFFHSIFPIVQFGCSLLFLILCLSFWSLYFSAHMYLSSTVQRGWYLNIQPHSPYISLYIASICKPEDGL